MGQKAMDFTVKKIQCTYRKTIETDNEQEKIAGKDCVRRPLRLEKSKTGTFEAEPILYRTNEANGTLNSLLHKGVTGAGQTTWGKHRINQDQLRVKYSNLVDYVASELGESLIGLFRLPSQPR